MEIVLLIAIYFSIFFIIGTFIKNNSIIDIGWGLGFVIVAWYAYWKDSSVVVGQFIMTLLITIWGLRLFYHIAKRNLGKGEDYRYVAFRKAWGIWVVPRAFLQVYMLQGFFLYIISLTVIITAYEGKEADSLLLMPGVILWLIGFFFEAIGDYQLNLFFRDANNKGKLMTDDRWRLTRHPNYFGEAAMWWGIFLIAIASGASVWTILSPVIITLLLLFVSGTSTGEIDKKPGFEEYVGMTNNFFPGFLKK